MADKKNEREEKQVLEYREKNIPRTMFYCLGSVFFIMLLLIVVAVGYFGYNFLQSGIQLPF